MLVRNLIFFLSMAGGMGAQESSGPQTDEPQLKIRTEIQTSQVPSNEPFLTVPAGAKVPLELRQPISTKGARAGDPIYARTTFPIVVGGVIVIPAGTWVQGTVDTVKRAGR